MIKWIFRWTFRLFLLLVVLVVAGILLLDTFAREYVEYQIHHQTGLEVKIEKVRIGLLNPELTIENMVLYNRAEFGGGPFIEMPELHIEYDRSAMASHKLHCKLMRFNLARVCIVEDKNGRNNLDSLEVKVMPRNSKNGTKSYVLRFNSNIEFAGIDTLNLTLGKVTYLRMNRPGKADEYKLNIDHQVFTNIKSENDFSGVLMVAFLRSGSNLFQNGTNGQSLLQLFSPPKK